MSSTWNFSLSFLKDSENKTKSKNSIFQYQNNIQFKENNQFPNNNLNNFSFPPPFNPSFNISNSNLKNLHKVSIGSIVIFFVSIPLWIISMILLILTILNFVNDDSTSIINNPLFYAFLAFIILTSLFIGIGNLVCGIIGSLRTSEISKIDRDFNILMILYIIGIFISLVQVVAAFMTLSKIKNKYKNISKANIN